MNGAPLRAAELAWIRAGTILALAAATLAIVRPALAATRPSGHGGGPTARAAGAAYGAFVLAVGAIVVGVAIRWARLGHGPFLTMFEILVSNVASLGVVYAVVHAAVPSARRAAPVAIAIVALLAAWSLVADPADSRLPPTYETLVLWLHVLLGKMFLGCALVATGLAGAVLLGRAGRGEACVALDELAWRFLRVALVFETAMLIAGAVWAQNAWGRWWAWDPLETWAFATWLALAGALHARGAYRLGPRAGATLAIVVFVLAFLTFFGVPFVSVAPHQGAV